MPESTKTAMSTNPATTSTNGDLVRVEHLKKYFAVQSGFFATLLTRGNITPLRKAPLVATKYTTTTSTMSSPKTPAIARSQPRRFRGAGALTFVSVIKILCVIR